MNIRRKKTHYDRIDLDELLKHRRQIAIIWSTDDVREMRPDLTENQAWKVLQLCDRRAECELGLSWALIELTVEELFPQPQEDDQETDL